MRLFAVFAVFCLLLPATPVAWTATPNLVLIYVDDLGYGDLGVYGHPVVKTPNIDQLATQGVRFTQFYAPAPLCSPSRAGMLTGRTPYRTGIRSWIPDGQDVHLGENEITIANLLRDKGYATAVMGKLHLNGGAEMEDHPQADDMGFDYSFIITGGWAKNARTEAVTSDGSLRRGPMFPDNFWRNGEAVGETTKFSAELVSDEAIRWLEQLDNDQPFFLYLPYSEVHTPVASPQRHLDSYSEFITDSAREYNDVFHWDWKGLPWRGSGEYYANISFLDEQAGRVIDKLEAMGISDQTIVIFTSDNGPVTRETRKPWEIAMAGETGGLRGRKDNLFEGGIRVPAIMRFPAQIERGSVTDAPVHGLDLLPTLAEIMGFEAPADRELDGQSITALLRGDSINRSKPLFWTIDMPGQDDPVNEWAIRDGDWKLILDRDEQPRFLFNIAADPYELYNLMSSEKEVLAGLMVKFNNYRENIERDATSLARSTSD